MDADAAVPDSHPLPPDRPVDPQAPLLAWPPPGLERLRGDLWAASARLAVGGSILVLPLLASLSLPQDPWRPSIFGDAWWILFVTSVTGLWMLMGGFVRVFRLLGRWRAAIRSGYRARTVAMVLADRAGDTGYLVQGARAYSLIPESVRRLLVIGRLAQAALAVGSGLWLGAAFIGGVLGAARGIVSESGVALWTLGPPIVALALVAVLRAFENTFVIKARRAWHAKPWSDDLAKEDIQAWHKALGERENALEVPAGAAGAGGGPQRAAAIATAIVGLIILVFTVPLVSVAGIGPFFSAVAVPKFSATIWRAGRIEAFQALRPPVDASITVERAGDALFELISPQDRLGIFRTGQESRPDVFSSEERVENPTGLRPELWARDLVPRLEEGLEPSVVAYLRGLGARPGLASMAVLSRASALDEVAALYDLPLPEDLDMWRLPIPRFSGIRELAYAQVGAAVGEAAVGRVDDAEARLRELIGAGALMEREGTTLISNLVGTVIAGIGGEALLNLYDATGRSRDAAELRARIEAAEAAMRKVSVGARSIPFDAMPSVVTDTSAVRGLRWEYFGSLSAIGPCLNLQRAVFGPPGDYGAWLDRVRSSLVRHEGEEEILRVMRRGFSRVDQREGGLMKVARLYSQVMGGGVGSCAELIAAAALW